MMICGSHDVTMWIMLLNCYVGHMMLICGSCDFIVIHADHMILLHLHVYGLCDLLFRVT